MSKSRTHIFIPDTQVKPGVSTAHIKWIGQFIVDERKKDPVIIMIGDWYDLESLSTYDRGKASFEGRRYFADIEAGHMALDLLEAPLRALQAKQRKNKERVWEPERHYLLGNHEHRADRIAEQTPELEGTIGTFQMREYWEERGWNTYGFLEVIDLDGVWYSHYFPNEFTGKPLGGMPETMLKNIGHSFSQGHVQAHKTAMRMVGDQRHRALISGACYTHDEDYKGSPRSKSVRTGNHHWRGIVVKHEVRDGNYDLMEVSLDFLCRRYEGMSLDKFMASKRYARAA